MKHLVVAGERGMTNSRRQGQKMGAVPWGWGIVSVMAMECGRWRGRCRGTTELLAGRASVSPVPGPTSRRSRGRPRLGVRGRRTVSFQECGWAIAEGVCGGERVEEIECRLVQSKKGPQGLRDRLGSRSTASVLGTNAATSDAERGWAGWFALWCPLFRSRSARIWLVLRAIAFTDGVWNSLMWVVPGSRAPAKASQDCRGGDEGRRWVQISGRPWRRHVACQAHFLHRPATRSPKSSKLSGSRHSLAQLLVKPAACYSSTRGWVPSHSGFYGVERQFLTSWCFDRSLAT
jgi:hypothetical protein